MVKNLSAKAHQRARTALTRHFRQEWPAVYQAARGRSVVASRRQWLAFVDLRDRHPRVWQRLLGEERVRLGLPAATREQRR